MRFLRGLIFAGCLIFGELTVHSQAPKPPVEYNFAGCTAKGFNVDHILVYNNKLEFTHHLVSAGKVEKNSPEDELVFDYREESKDKDGNTKFHAEYSEEGHKAEINGIIRGDKLIGLILVDGVFVEAVYGQVGKVEDIAKDHTGADSDKDFQFCLELHQHPKEEVPQELVKWLLAQTNKSS